MYDIFQAIILGVVEGVTEFLPISSTGHLIIVNQWLSFSEPFTTMFDVVIQLGAILAVVVFFRHRLWPFGSSEQARQAVVLWKKAIVGVVPALIIGFLAKDVIEERLFNPLVVAVALVVGGIVLIILEKRTTKQTVRSAAELTYGTVLAIGLFQCLAMVPGVSRSAATIVGAMLLGATRLVAVEFSFFLAIPTMAAASGYALLKNGLTMSGTEMQLLAVGFATAFLVAWFVVATFMKYIQTKNFIPFGWYRIVLGCAVFAYFWL